MNFLYSLFGVTIFLSSFLLFQVQPLIGKHILPWFGGSSTVWITAMLFFMVALAVGYIYALLISRFRLWYQVIIHILVIIFTIIVIKNHSSLWPSAITPNIDDLIINFTEPTTAIFLTLLFTIGLPFVLLSSTSSLLQLWYGKLSGKEPFSLYGISNIGSLLGLLSYPVFFERYFSTYDQGAWWTYAFMTYIALLLMILYVLLFFNNQAQKKSDTVKIIFDRRFLRWMGLAGVPVIVMLAGTAFMTVAIAPVPFLWVGPLALYLLSFVITFREGLRLPFWTNELLVVTVSLISFFTLIDTNLNAVLAVLIVHFAMFAIYHWCHEHLYKLRPKTEELTLFYVALSIGGILGSLFIKLANTYIFTLPIELVLIFVIVVLIIAFQWFKKEDFYLPIATRFQLKLFSVLISIFVLLGSFLYIYQFEKEVIAKERNFFGYKAVIDSAIGENPVRALQHGKTNHGYQVYIEGGPQIIPTSYYTKTAGVGKVFAHLQNQKEDGLQVAVVGLGSGGLLSYCRDNDRFTVFEIDPEIIYMANKYFTFLEHCLQKEVVLSDARLALEKIKQEQNKEMYDLIVIDAYADDLMPIHLMTSEAISLYKSLLTSNGILAVHISSRYLNLLPVIKSVAMDNNMSARYLFDENPDIYGVKSLWTMMAKNEEVFTGEYLDGLNNFDNEKEVLWTDTFSALLPVVKF